MSGTPGENRLIALVLGGVALLTAWVPQKRFVVFAFAAAAFILGAIGAYRCSKKRIGPPAVSQLGTLLGVVTLIAGPGGPADGGPASTANGDENYRMEPRTPANLPR